MGLALAAIIGQPMEFTSAKAEQPHIIIIMTDDMGFSDLGCFGSEIETPNLDMLAKQGLRFTQDEYEENQYTITCLANLLS